MSAEQIMKGRKLAIKFLFSNVYAGLLIGNGGKSIKELIEVSDARVNVSGINETYPGTNDRVVMISGDFEAVSLAQTLVWEMLAQMAKEGNNRPKNVEWSPKVAVGSLSQNDEVFVECKLSIPASASGFIIGRGGATIKGITEESGAKVSMSSKDEALFTQERIISVSGEAGSCIKCCDLILAKLNEQEEIEPFVNRGTTYSSPLEATFGLQGGNSFCKKMGGKGKGVQEEVDAGGDSSITNTTITLTIADELIGNIFGKQGVTMREIIQLSGASIEVSPRGVFAEGTNNRIVTITGSPIATQSAHLFISQKMQNPSNQNRYRNPNYNNSKSSGTGNEK